MDTECNIKISIIIDTNELSCILTEIKTTESMLLEKGLEIPYLHLLFNQLKEVQDSYDF